MEKKKSGKKKKIIILVIIAALIGGGAYWIHQKKAAEAAANVEYQSYTPLEKTDVLQEVKTSGKIQSTVSKNITAAADGKIMKVFVEEGDRVTKGQTLAILDSSAIVKQITTAQKTREADLKSAKTARDTAKNDYETAKLNYSVGDIAKQDLIKAKNAYNDAITAYNDKVSDDSSLSALQTQLDNCTIKATVSGTITAMNATVGNNSSGSMFTIENPGSLKIVVTVNEYDINSIKQGQRAIVKTEMTSDQEFKGRVTKVAEAAIKSSDGTTATTGKAQFQVEIKILNPTEQVKIGGNARADIVLSGKRNVLAVTSDCLSSDKDGNSIVFTYKKSGDKYIAKAIKVETGVSNDIYVQVSGDGLKEGMNILNNASALKDGQEVVLGTE